MTREQASILYDRLYKKADKLIKKYNPCQFDKVTGLCIAIRKNNTMDGWKTPFVLCCRGCSNHSTSGCTVQSLGCKLYLCAESEKVLGKVGKEEVFNIRWNGKCLPNTIYRGKQSMLEDIDLREKTSKRWSLWRSKQSDK